VRFRRIFRMDILIVLLAMLARLLPSPRTVDDAYITFRYARNLLAGNGLVYNPGEAVLGTTTPLYAALMAFLGLFTGGTEAPFPELAWLLNIGADALVCWMLIKFGEQWGKRRVGLAVAAIWAIAPWSVTFAIGGLETSFFVCLTVATLYFHSTGRPVAAGLTGAASLITRPDALLFLIPLTLERCRRSLPPGRLNPDPKPIQLKEALAFLLPTSLWIAVGTGYYGTPLPHSILAKTSAYYLPADAGLVRLLQHYATPFLGHEVFGTPWIGVGLVFYPALFGLGALHTLRGRIGLWPAFAYPWIYFLAFVVANPLIFRWYLTPPLPWLILGILLGVDRISQDFRRPNIFTVFIIAAALSTLSTWSLRPDHGRGLPAPEMAYIKLELKYEQAARWIDERIEEDEVLAGADIGALGYFTEARMLDVLGLISPQSVPYYPLSPETYPPGMNYAIPTDLVLHLEPDYLVMLEVYGRNTLLRSETFLHRYRLVHRLPTDIYESKGMLIFQREVTMKRGARR
jgi:hypothetical protein